jgi:Tfp pilus assembly protein PilV
MSGYKPSPGQRAAGFTFVEVLAALLFLAIVVPAIVQALSIANRASVMTERHAIAGEYAENKLNELLTGNAWANAPNSSGDFGGGAPGYRWKMSSSNWAADTVNQMTELAVDVYYTVQGREYSVHLSTLVSQPTTTTGASTGTSTNS